MPPEIIQWLQDTSLATAIRESAIVFPVILSLHLTGMGLFGGMILMTDLRLLGISMTKRPVSDVVNGLRPWKHLGLTLTAGCGILLLWSKAAIYYPNPYLRIKLVLFALIIIHALVFRSVYRNVADLDRSPGDSGPGQAGSGALADSLDLRGDGGPVDRVLGAEGRAGKSRRLTSGFF